MFKGFFNRMYNGNPNRPDIDPEDMPRNKYELFFTTLGVRFGDLIKLNLLYALFLLPFIVWTILSFMAMNSVSADMTADQINQHLLGSLQMYLLGMIPCLALAGPPTAGLTYIARNWSRDEHAWLWSDFREHMAKNWKQGALLGLIMGLALFIGFLTLYNYSNLMAQNQWMWVMQLIFIVLLALFLLSFMYAFPMMVTYKLKVSQILRNSLMLALGRLPFTILFGVLGLVPALLFVVAFAMFQSMIPVLVFVLFYLIIGFALTAFVANSYTNATFLRLMRADSEDMHIDPEDGEGPTT